MTPDATAATVLDFEAIGAVDPSGILGDTLDLPEHLRDAAWRVDSAQIAAPDRCDGVIVAGMGGSAIGGSLARAILGDETSLPFATARDYQLPSWVTPNTLVLCASYSGETEETLAIYEAAGILGAPRLVVTTGGRLGDQARAEGIPVIPVPAGFQPRAAVAYMVVAALEAAAMAGAGPRLRTDLDVAGEHLQALVREWGPDSPDDSLGKSLARAIHETIPVIAGAQLTAPVAYRWKCQINENAKVPAFSHELPELDHNELVGWEAAETVGRFSAIFLDDCDLHPRLRQRIALTRELVEPHAVSTHVVETRGSTRLERTLSLVLLGDLVSIYLAVLRGVDPAPVEIITSLKSALADG